jgi:hypothetical protein
VITNIIFLKVECLAASDECPEGADDAVLIAVNHRPSFYKKETLYEY